MDSFALLGELAIRLHEQFREVFYLCLPAFFALSLVVAWFKNPAGGPDFIESIKRACVATLLLVAFKEITDVILAITNGLADKVSDMSGLDAILKMAGDKAQSYTLSVTSVILGFNDLLIATLSFLSYLLLYVARYLMVAVYHFSWIFLMIIAPIVLLFHLFSPRITLNLFQSLIEVASWNVVWAVLSAMLKALPFGNAYAADGNYLTVIVLNVVIALAMLCTPLIVKAIVGHGVAAITGTLAPAAVTTMVIAPTKGATLVKFGREV
ncbi:MAG: hypothetical protein HY537_17615, partial [Deltaproteobacteria bacterium]|nr:hypothetical protein [Deltaproteobacteria bacterium]